jgi:chemotaxis protein histidine kinase CheA
MKKVVALEVTAQTGQVEQSVGNIRKELKGAKSELIAAQASFGTYSKEALAAAKRVAELKDQIADANETAALFDPGNKFAAFSNALSAVAGGFAAVQGAQALLGSESEDLAKTLAKVQGALALSQGLSQIKDMGKNFGEVSAVIKGPVIKAFTTLRGAIIATGIGALAIGITLLIANFDKVKDAVMKLIPGLSTFTKTIGNIITAVTDFVGITSEAERGLDKLRSANERFQEDSENRIRVLQAMGGKEREIYQERVQQTEGELNVLRNALKVKGKLSDEELKRFRELKTQMQVLQIDENKRNDENQKKEKDKKDAEAKAQNDKATADANAARQKANEDKKRRDEDAKQRKTAEQKLAEDLRRERMTEQQRELDDVKRQYEERLKQANGNRDLERQAFESAEDQRSKIRLKYQQFNEEKLKEHIDAMLAEEERERQEKKEKETQDLENKKNKLLTEANDEQLSFDERLAKIQEREALANQIVFKSEEERTAFNKANADARVKIAEDEAQAKQEQLMRGAALLSNISQLVGKETVAGKATAIAAATIDTYAAAWGAFKNAQKNPISILGPAYPYIQAGLAVAGGIANIRRIASVKVPNSSGGGASVPSGAAISAAPRAPIAPQAQTTQLDQSSINAVGNAAAGRAFVLNTDIQNNQERIARLNRAARIN